MTVQRFYRTCLWLPVLVPASLIAIAIAARITAADTGPALEAIGYSFWVGGLPYAALAFWASRWMGGRTEADIRRLMYVSPLLMVGVFGVFALAFGLINGRTDAALGLARYGASVIIPLGYAYVGLTIVLRFLLGSRLSVTEVGIR